MSDSVKMKAKTVEQAISLALEVLGKSREEVDVKVLSEGEGGVLGVFGGKDAEVDVSLKQSAGESARRLLQDILDKMEFITLVSVVEEGVEGVRLDIKGEDMGRIIGREGATLDALQYLTSIILGKKRGERIRVSIDAEGYRDKRKSKVEEDAEGIAIDVEKSGREVALPPLSSSERRLVHLFIQEKHPNLTSYSKGEGSGRRVFIAPQGK